MGLFNTSKSKSAGSNTEKLAEPSNATNRSTEALETSQDWVKSLLNGGNIGGFRAKFISDIYKERVLYPHEEMAIAKKAFRYNAYVASAVTMRGRFITGGSIKVQSEDKGTENYLNQQLIETGLGSYADQLGTDITAGGNFYCERIYKDGQIRYYEYIPYYERMYADLDMGTGIVKQWLQEIPEKLYGIKYDTITYFGDRKRTVKGRLIEKNKLFQIKLGVAEIPCYGRGAVCSVINDVEILLEIERAMAVIARYKAIPRKLIMLDRADDVNGGKNAAYYSQQISQLADEENPIVPELMQVADLSYNGKDLNTQPILDYLKKKITVALAPSYILHGDETNYAVSHDQKESWILTFNTERDIIAKQIKTELQILANSQGKPIKDFEVVFGDFDLGQYQYRNEQAEQLYNAGLITLNEAREMIGKDPDKEIGDFYKTDIQANSNLTGTDGEQDNTQDDGKTPKEDLERLRAQVNSHIQDHKKEKLRSE